jgi:hypothetical protein
MLSEHATTKYFAVTPVTGNLPLDKGHYISGGRFSLFWL